MKKRNSRLNIQIYFTLLVLAVMGGTMLSASLLDFILNGVLKVRIPVPTSAWVMVFSLFLGCMIAAVANRFFFAPITALRRAMNQVARGDFNIQLKSTGMVGEIREMYADFNVMVKELDAIEILRSDFVSNVSHEFKTPINAIEGYAMLLQGDEASGQEQKEYVRRILFNTRRLSELVSNILLLSKIDNRVIQSKQTTFRLDEQVRQALLMLEPKWTEKGIDFEVNLEEISYTGNEGLLIHVWSNLMDNAIKFSPNGGLIALRLEGREGQVQFSIEDQGPGVPAEKRTHIFEKFYQVDSSHKEEGNGLGLALVKGIVDLHGGSIQVEDGSSGGCLFVITLPLAAEG